MTNSQRLATVRTRFLRWLTEHHNNPEDGDIVIEAESILIRDEHYCGRRFRTSSHHAVWFIEEDVLKIYANSGGLACVMAADEIDPSRNMADTTPTIFAIASDQSKDRGGQVQRGHSETFRRAA